MLNDKDHGKNNVNKAHIPRYVHNDVGSNIS